MSQPFVCRPTSRREFLKHSGVAATGAALAGGLGVARTAHAAGDDLVRVALIGCGGRGVGAAVNALANTGHANVKVVALADAFQDRVDFAEQALTKRFPEKVDVPNERKFVGLDCHVGALGAGVDVVLLCGPPGFRPEQFEAAVKAGKHVFMEKPVATDSPGVRRIMAANEEAKQKNLAVAVGHHLRHEVKHQEAIARIHEGAIGELCYTRAYFNSTGVWVRPRQPDQTEMQYQTRNWYYFTWLSGDHIVEQHVHDLDVCNWMANALPVEANGMGGRQVRTGKDVGEIFDHHFVEFTYANGLRMFSQCRHQPGCWNSFSEHAHGTKGYVNIQGHGGAEMVVGEDRVRWDRGPDGHQVEMDVLFQKIAAGQPHNEGDYGATSTMTAILGRMATYSGKIVKWDEALASNLELVPRQLSWDADPGPKPGPDGIYPCAIPGVTQVL
ncbi:MAG: Gfo/Idh/MocA family oxidoreductase [Thermoguttaceae bacterium]|jgi:predicted dehydrogenase|nr:Gfo/Idh/MocA family oxidoreductase [Thermoguttaceae bacterium]